VVAGVATLFLGVFSNWLYEWAANSVAIAALP